MLWSEGALEMTSSNLPFCSILKKLRPRKGKGLVQDHIAEIGLESRQSDT